MNVYGSPDEQQPVTWWRGHPIYAAHLLVAVFVGSMLITTLVNLTGASGVLTWLVFDSSRVLRGEVWRLVTYGLVNEPSPGFVIDMFMIVWFGREAEKVFGQRGFFQLYAGIYLITPVLFTLIGFWQPMTLAGETGAFALFIAFALLYPDVMMLLNIQAKWIALILLSIYTLIALNGRSGVALVSLWAPVAVAFVFVRYRQGRLALPEVTLPRPRTSRPATTPVERQAAPTDLRAEMDALLDKIATSGMASLTTKERARLEAARTELLRRESGRR